MRERREMQAVRRIVILSRLSRRTSCLPVAATMRLCRADHPCLTPPIRGWPVPGPPRASRSQPTSTVAAGRVVCGAKRIRSHYLPSPTERPPGLSTRTQPNGPASLSTINAATMRLCRADHPFLTPPIRGWPVPPVPSLSREKPLPQSSSSQSLQLEEKDGQIRDRSRWAVHNAGEPRCGFSSPRQPQLAQRFDL